MKSLKGKTALVTGAAMGMGKMLSTLLLESGCRVALVDINRDLLEETGETLSKKGISEAFVCDISDSTAVKELVDTVNTTFGPVDVLVNNAGIVRAKPLLDLTENEINAMIQVNLTAQFWTTRAFLPGMMERNEGHIVNFASAGGILAIPNLSAYCASKFGVIGFSDAIRQEIKRQKRKVGVTVVCPNTVNTGMFKGAKMVTGTKILTPEKVCKQVMKGIKDNQAIVAVPSVSVKILTPLLKTILPVGVMDSLNKALGMWDANDSTVGRSA